MVITDREKKPLTIKTAIISIFNTLLLFSVLIGATAQAANITVTTSRNPVALDDSFHLIYEADSNVDDDPDFSPVYQNFDILSSSQSTNMRSINGNWSLKKTWDLTVIAKDIGKFTIAPIKFGKDLSPAIQISIVNSSSPNRVTPDGQSTIPAKIFLESSIDKKSGWVQSQFVYSIRLLRTVDIANASLSEPETSDTDAIIKKISEDNYQTTRNGIQYEIFERSYAIFPQRSGTIKINPITFEGRINAQQPRSIFDQFRMSGQIKRIRSKAIELNVKPAPGSVNLQDWLPASHVQLIEEWSDDIKNITAGEPVTRTITIAAEGLSAVQLPDLQFENIKDLKQYPDKSVSEDKQTATGITGLRQIKVALIPASAGSYTLPEIRLQWWNTKTNKKEVATLAQVIITATGSAITSAAKIQANVPVALDNALPAENKKPSAVTTIINNEPYWKWLALFFAIAWLITLLALINKSKVNKSRLKNKSHKPLQSVKSAASMVEKQAKNDNAEETKLALITWAKIFYNNKDITNLSQIADYCSAGLKQAIRLLNESLYSTDKVSWQGNELLTAFKEEKKLKHKQADKQASVLKPLYNQ